MVFVRCDDASHSQSGGRHRRPHRESHGRWNDRGSHRITDDSPSCHAVHFYPHGDCHSQWHDDDDDDESQCPSRQFDIRADGNGTGNPHQNSVDDRHRFAGRRSHQGALVDDDVVSHRCFVHSPTCNSARDAIPHHDRDILSHTLSLLRYVVTLRRRRRSRPPHWNPIRNLLQLRSHRPRRLERNEQYRQVRIGERHHRGVDRDFERDVSQDGGAGERSERELR
mmetsp:Transcript_6700/g.13335  ORF Transcript_6700/g.13335 Transcript_6700/m.13335 type:complete len:224 (+) Transcript_6700:638-1309(+)